MTRPGAPLLQAALNGTWDAEESAAVPRDPAGLAAAAADAVAAGAREVRIRPRTPCGGGSLSPRVVGPALTAVRGLVGVPVSVAADAWAEPDPERRVARIRSWELLPELAWVAWHEPGAEETAEALLAAGVAVEAGLRAGTAGPALFARSPLADRVRRIAAEVPETAAAEAEPWARALPGGPGGAPVLLCGTGAAAWPVARLARRLGLAGRIGLEDTLFLPDGRRARSTAEQVRAALLDGP
ncbi:3-keto-5-aminohexanoate cleavage protein [Streptomyces sp. CC208A]|uniref:3-keto-5-aminohexanoate cleavage protein n=1 Tax=Streptomyces sp. CC208A TaxID=3044573 RepID=UPI0024A9EF00|nr:3-keto-5-aminohexanoate cleavage protein [Streptomyces sp. CC208A]